MTRSGDIIIVGAGIIGMMTARELAQAGFDVTLIDRGTIGGVASRAASGILSPIRPWESPPAVELLARWSREQYPEMVSALESETGVDAELLQSGALILGVEDPGPALSWADQRGLEAHLLLADDLRDCEPALAEQWHEALYLPRVAQVRTTRLLEAIERGLSNANVDILDHTAVQGLLIRGGRVVGVRSDRGIIECPRVMLAAGAWTGELARSAGGGVAIRPIRGEMIWYKAEPGAVSRVLVHGEYYVIPRRDGVCLVGTTVEAGDDDRSRERELRKAASRLLPMLGELEPEGYWTGLRPGNVTGVPVIDEHPAIGGLFVNSGHFRNGITLAPASTRLMADLILGREPILDPSPYRLKLR